jgi:hypothetical protein
MERKQKRITLTYSPSSCWTDGFSYLPHFLLENSEFYLKIAHDRFLLHPSETIV